MAGPFSDGCAIRVVSTINIATHNPPSVWWISTLSGGKRAGRVAKLVRIDEEVQRGDSACPPTIHAALSRRVGSLAAERSSPTVACGLTGREMETLEFIARGLSNKDIAARLYIALATVKNH